jgi:hypothetical protein
MGQAIARPDDEAVKSIIRMKSETGPYAAAGAITCPAGSYAEIDGDKMARNLLSGASEAALAFLLQELHRRLIGTAYGQRAAVQMQKRQLLEPLARAAWVECLGTLKYISKNVFYVAGNHTTIPCESMPHPKGKSPPEHPCQRFSIFSRAREAKTTAQQRRGDNKNLAGIVCLVKGNLYSQLMTAKHNVPRLYNRSHNTAGNSLEISANTATIRWAGFPENTSAALHGPPTNLRRKADDYGNLYQNGGILQRPLGENA